MGCVFLRVFLTEKCLCDQIFHRQEISLCYNFFMLDKRLMQSYQARWEAVKKIQDEEQRFASLELRWRQLNAAYGLGKSLGFQHHDADEMKVVNRWANLKKQAINRKTKA